MLHDLELAHRLCSAAAVPVMSYEARTNQQNRWYPDLATRNLEAGRAHGEPHAFLYALTFAPHIVRRIAFRLFDVGRGAAKVLSK